MQKRWLDVWEDCLSVCAAVLLVGLAVSAFLFADAAKSFARAVLASEHDGRCSVHEYRFECRGTPHTEEEIGRLGLGESCRFGSDVSVDVRVEWPEDGLGLPKETLDKVRREILKMAFSDEIDVEAMDGSLERTLAEIKKLAEQRHGCTPVEKDHCCSRWNFSADVRLDCPFGIEEKDGAKWYERPVVCVWNSGYSNDGGNGCHSFFGAGVYDAVDGRELKAEDYFAPDKIGPLSALVWKRLVEENCIDVEDESVNDPPQIDISGQSASMLVTKEGVKWSFAPYSYFAGCYGVTSATFKWDELAEYAKRSSASPAAAIAPVQVK